MYQLTNTTAVVRNSDGALIPADPRNVDYQQYLAWVAAGGIAAPHVPTQDQAREDQTKADISDIRADAKFQNLISKTPLQAKNWVDNSFPTLTAPERKDLATIVIAVGVLGRRL